MQVANPKTQHEENRILPDSVLFPVNLLPHQNTTGLCMEVFRVTVAPGHSRFTPPPVSAWKSPTNGSVRIARSDN